MLLRHFNLGKNAMRADLPQARCSVSSVTPARHAVGSVPTSSFRAFSTTSSLYLKTFRLNTSHKFLHRSFSSTARVSFEPIDGLSHAKGSTSSPLLSVTLSSFWNDMVKRYPTSPALVVRHEASNVHSLSFEPGQVAAEDDCIRWTFEEMDRNIDALARGLLKRGVKKGDRIGVFLGNNSAYACLQWATAKIGAVLVCINPSAPGPELLATINLSGVSVLFISPTFRKNQHLPMLRKLIPRLSETNVDQDLNDAVCPTLTNVIIVDNTRLGAKGFAEMLKGEGFEGRDLRKCFEWEGERLPEVAGQSIHDVINHQFTSGTTGIPKAVALTHSNILNNGLLIGDCMHLREPDAAAGWSGERLINAPPFFHCFGLVLGNLAFWTHGGCIIVASEAFDPAQALRAAYLERATALHGVPTMFISELNLLDKLEKGEHVEGLSDLVEKAGTRKLQFPELRTGIAAGSPVPDEVMRKLVKRMNLKDLTITYGQTETSPASFMSTIHDPLELRCTTVGRVLPHTHARIVDPLHPLYPSPETPSLPVNEPGELFSGGYLIMDSYHQNPSETEKAVFYDEHGIKWLRTGDVATMDEQGYVKIRGRTKDIIIRGGENLFPVVIEARSLLLDGVEDAYAIAIPDKLMGEVVGVFVERANTAAGKNLKGEDLRKHIHKELGHQSAPDWVFFMGEDGVEAEWPKTASGKIRKVDLREWAKPLVERKIGSTRA